MPNYRQFISVRLLENRNRTVRRFFIDPYVEPGFNLPGPAWWTLNRFCTSQSLCAASVAWRPPISVDVGRYRQHRTQQTSDPTLCILTVIRKAFTLLIKTQLTGSNIQQWKHSQNENWTRSNKHAIITMLRIWLRNSSDNDTHTINSVCLTNVLCLPLVRPVSPKFSPW